MADIATHFPPQTYSSSFFLNSLQEEEKVVRLKKKRKSRPPTRAAEDSPQLLDCFTKTMSRFFHIFVMLTLITKGCKLEDPEKTYHPEPNIQCSEEFEPRIRTFPNIVKYQGNSVSFKKDDPYFEGNYVSFADRTIAKIRSNDFLTKTSIYIIKLFLDHKQIGTIGEGGFRYLDCLKYLDLQYNRIHEIHNYTFFEVPNLLQLNLSHNALETIEDGSFEELRSLKTLDLSFNGIKVIEKYAFLNLDKLKRLDLSRNRIESVNPESMRHTPALQSLVLSNNRIKEVALQEWTNLDNLKKLNFGHNLIEYFSFNNITGLVYLLQFYLHENKIKDLDLTGIKGSFPDLEELYLSNNSLTCAHFNKIAAKLEDVGVLLKISPVPSENCVGGESGTTISSTDVFTSPPKEDRPTTLEGENLQQNNTIFWRRELDLEDRVQNLRDWMIGLFTVLFIIGVGFFVYKFQLVQRISARRLRGMSSNHYLLSDL